MNCPQLLLTERKTNLSIRFSHREIKPMSSRRQISTNRFPESIRGSSVNLIRTVCMVRGGSDGYRTVREGSGHFPACSKIWLSPPHHSIRLEIRIWCVSQSGDFFIRIVRPTRRDVELG